MKASPPPSAAPADQPWQLTLCLLFVAQLLSIIGFSFTLPFIPFYVRELGVTDERLVPIWAGVMAASASLVMAFFSPLWGWLADRHGRKIMVERAMFGGAFVTFAMGLVDSVWQLLFLRILSGATTGTISASIAMISSVVPRQRMGFSLGLMQVAVFLGMTLGPWIGGLMADAFGYRYTFMAGGVVLLAGGLLVLFGTRERFTRPSAESLLEGSRLLALLGCTGYPTMLALFFFLNFTLYFIAPILPLFIESLHGMGRSGVATTTGMLFAVSGGAGALAAAGIGLFSDRVGYKPLLAAGFLLTALSLLLHGMAQSVLQLLLLRILYGISAGGMVPTMNALVGRLVPSNGYGMAFGLTASMTCLGMAAGPFLGGFLGAWWGYRWPFALVFAMMVLVGLPMVLSIRQRPLDFPPPAEAADPGACRR